MAVLDTMLQPLEAEPDAYIVYYNILDGDQNGRAPNCPNFDASEKSCLHKIAKSNNKVKNSVFVICSMHAVHIHYCFCRKLYITKLFDCCCDVNGMNLLDLDSCMHLYISHAFLSHTCA